MTSFAPKPPSVAHGRLSPLDDPSWRYVEARSLDAFTVSDWDLLNRQRAPFYERHQANEVLRMLSASADDPAFGYCINNYRHCLQAASMALRGGEDDETVVVALLHDIGFIACPVTHGAFAAALLAAYVDERHHWMLLHHQAFQSHHCATHPGCDPTERERWRGHPHFAWTARFVERYDQNAIDPDYENIPLSAFEPMVLRLFARPARLAANAG